MFSSFLEILSNYTVMFSTKISSILIQIGSGSRNRYSQSKHSGDSCVIIISVDVSSSLFSSKTVWVILFLI